MVHLSTTVLRRLGFIHNFNVLIITLSNIGNIVIFINIIICEQPPRSVSFLLACLSLITRHNTQKLDSPNNILLFGKQNYRPPEYHQIATSDACQNCQISSLNCEKLRKLHKTTTCVCPKDFHFLKRSQLVNLQAF